MKKRFKSNQVETCGNGSTLTKKEQRANAKNMIKEYKKRLKEANRYMNVLKDMSSDYDYHQESLNTLVGNVYIRIDRLEGWIENEQGVIDGNS